MTEKWTITRSEDDNSILIEFMDGGRFTLGNDLVQRIWKHLDLGKQPVEQGFWLVEDDEDWGGLKFTKYLLGGGASHWGMTPNALEALVTWREVNGPPVELPPPVEVAEEAVPGLKPEDLGINGLTEKQSQYFDTLRLLDPEGELKDLEFAARKRLREKNQALLKKNAESRMAS